MNYNKIFDENPNKTYFFNNEGYPHGILVDGFVSLENAKARLSKQEYYALVTYQDGEELPDCYEPISEEIKNDMEAEGLFATVKPDVSIQGFSHSGGIQIVSKLPAPSHDQRYLLGPGPEEILLSDLVKQQLEAYMQEYKFKNR